MDYIWGIDLGGTKIEGVIAQANDFENPLLRLRVPTEAHLGYDHILRQISLLCHELKEKSLLQLPSRIGIGTPGAIDSVTGTLKGSNTQCLNGRLLQTDLSMILGIDAHLINDANCFALAEATHGAAKGYETVFGVILGTGVGGGLVVKGQVLNGRHGIAGEWGQIIIKPNGPTSNYGTKGTIESLISGPALEKYYRDRTHVQLDLKEISSRTKKDPDAAATINHLMDYLAESLAIVINLFDPYAIVLGGGVGNIQALYTTDFKEKLSAKVFTPVLKTAILKPKLGDSAGVFGAALFGALPDGGSVPAISDKPNL